MDASAGPTQDGKWRLAVKVTKFSGTGSVTYGTGSEMSFLPREWQGEGVGENTQECVNPGSPLILLRWREDKSIKGSFRQDPQPCDGIMIWIEEAK